MPVYAEKAPACEAFACAGARLDLDDGPGRRAPRDDPEPDGLPRDRQQGDALLVAVVVGVAPALGHVERVGCGHGAAPSRVVAGAGGAPRVSPGIQVTGRIVPRGAGSSAAMAPTR